MCGTWEPFEQQSVLLCTCVLSNVVDTSSAVQLQTNIADGTSFSPCVWTARLSLTPQQR
jgi:hypothetical protein